MYPSKPDYRECAESKYASEELQIDADAEVSVGDDGAWVAAWVYVSDDATNKHGEL